MIEKLKTIGSVLLGLLLLPIVFGGRIPKSIGEYLLEVVALVICILLVLSFLFFKDSRKKRSNSSRNDTKVICPEPTVPTIKNSIEKNTKYIDISITKNTTSQDSNKIEIKNNYKNTSNNKNCDNSQSNLIDQKIAILKVVFWLTREEIVITNKKKIEQFINLFSIKLGLHCTYGFIVMPTISDIDKYVKTIKSIQDDKLLLMFINACRKVIYLESDICIWTPHDYEMILVDLGFSKENIQTLRVLYNTKELQTIYVLPKRNYNKPIESQEKEKKVKEVKKAEFPQLIEEYPVSKEQMAIFEKNWTLSQFRKEFGIEDRVESKKNHTWNEDYKVCIFIKNSDDSEFEVRLSNSLGEPSIGEIQRREKELMVGLSDYGNYKLYDNKIPVLEKINLGI